MTRIILFFYITYFHRNFSPISRYNIWINQISGYCKSKIIAKEKSNFTEIEEKESFWVHPTFFKYGIEYYNSHFYTPVLLYNYYNI